MGKSKRAPALLEVMQRQQSKDAAAPAEKAPWWKSKDGEPATPPSTEDQTATEPESAGEPTEVDEPAVQTAEYPAPAPAVRPPPIAPLPPEHARPARTEPLRRKFDDDDDVPPIVSLDEGRVTLSLNPVSTVIAVGSIVLAIFAGYVVGFLSGKSTSPKPAPPAAAQDDPLAEAARRPPNPGVLDVQPPKKTKHAAAPARQAASPRPKQTKTSAPTPGADPRKRGLNYLVLKDFEKKRGATAADATAAMQFLRQHGVPARLDTHPWGWRLWDALRGYTKAELKTKAGEIRVRQEHLMQLSNAYAKQGSQYLFDPYPVLYNGRQR